MNEKNVAILLPVDRKKKLQVVNPLQSNVFVTRREFKSGCGCSANYLTGQYDNTTSIKTYK